MIYDCFTFRNEWECLEIRLNELVDVVDVFVLVEAPWTFQGDPKPMLYKEQRPDWAADFRIRHIVLPPTIPEGDAWDRERIQRDGIAAGLGDWSPGDVVMVSDCDEIPRASEVPKAVAMIEAGSFQVSFEQELFFYHVDNRCYTTKWPGTQALLANNALWRTPEGVRRMRGTLERVPNGGWHFCNLGDPEWLIEKIESFAHTEVNLPEYKDPDFLAECIRQGREMTGREDILFEHTDDGDLPEFLLRNRERFGGLWS